MVWTTVRGYWVAGVLLLFAVVLVRDPLPFHRPVSALIPHEAWYTDISPVRKPKLKPRYEVAGYDYRCSDCHRIIPSPSETDRLLTQHVEIVLEHGLNTRCFNCHHPTNRDAFVDYAGGEIPWDQPQLLCAKCHGTVYRDWQHGAHGRSNGYWLASTGAQTRLRCIECHEPHRPPFPALQPASGPHTLRVNPQTHATHSEPHGPLRVGAAAEGN